MAGTIKLGGNAIATHTGAVGGGTVTVQGNVVVPDGGTIGSVSSAGALTIDASGNTTATLSSSSNVKAPLNASGNAPVYACRAWVNFDGTGTVAIRESGNVSSITDNGTGQYTVNFTTAMPDGNYSVFALARRPPTETYTDVYSYLDTNTTPSSSSFKIVFRSVINNGVKDGDFVYISVVR